MSKKKINNRLNKLFEEIKQGESTAQPKGRKRKELLSSQDESINTASAQDETNRTEGHLPTLPMEHEVASLPTGVDYGHPSTSLSMAFRTDQNNWATLKVIDEKEKRAWSMEEQMLVKQVADQLSLAMENARLFQEAQRRAREMTALAEVGREISATLELQVVLERIASRALEILNAVTSAVYIPDPQFKQLIAITALGEEADEIKTMALNYGQGIIGNIALSKVGEIVNDVSNDPRAITIDGTEDISEEHLMAAPVMQQENLSGLLVVWRVGQKQDFTQTEFDFLQSLAQQAAIAVENARLFDETRKRTEELAALNEIITSASQSLELKSTLTVVLEKVLQTTGFDGGLITMFNEARGKLERAVRIGMPGQSPADPAQGLDGSLCDRVYRTGKMMVIDDISTNVPKGIDVSGDVAAGLRGYVGIPIETKGRTLGTLCIFRYLNEMIPENIIGLARTVGGQLGFTIENTLLFDQTQERAEELSVLNEMARELSSEMNALRISETAYHYASRLVDTENFFLAIYNERTQMITFPVFYEEGARIDIPARELGNGLTDHVIRNKSTLFMPDDVVRHMKRIGLDLIAVGNNKPAQSWLGVPLVVGNRAVGAIVVQSAETPNLFTERDKDLLVTVASQVAIALENARLFKEAQSRARREKILREITAHVRATNDPEMIAKTVVREVSQALGVSAFIRLGSNEEEFLKAKSAAAKRIVTRQKDGQTPEDNKNTAEGGK